MNHKTKISFVSPVYMGEPFVRKLIQELDQVASQLGVSHEIILVDDHSPDNSWQIIQKLSINNKNLKAIRLAENIGQHFAILEGLKLASGEYIVVLDCDLQDDPKSIPDLLSQVEESNYVLAKRKNRQSTWFEKLTSYCFYKVLFLIKGANINSKTVNFGIYNESLIHNIVQDQNNYKFFPLAVALHGQNKKEIEIDHLSRPEGSSSYSFKKRLQLGLYILGSKKNAVKPKIKESIHLE